ncbi:DUF6602 domain-containing protein [Chloroflexota bacterium]
MEIEKHFQRTQKDIERVMGDAGDFRNPTAVGNVREEVVRLFLSKYFPRRFCFQTGEVICAQTFRGTSTLRSRQQDIIMFDEHYHPKYYISDSSGLYFAESVFAVIEIKSNLTKPALRDAVKKIRSVKELPRDAYSPSATVRKPAKVYGEPTQMHPIAGMVISLDGPPIETTARNLRDIYVTHQVPLESRINLIWVLRRGVIGLVATGTTRFHLFERCEGFIDDADNSLLHFYNISSILAHIELPPVDLSKYLTVSTEAKAFKEEVRF